MLFFVVSQHRFFCFEWDFFVNSDDYRVFLEMATGVRKNKHPVWSQARYFP